VYVLNLNGTTPGLFNLLGAIYDYNLIPWRLTANVSWDSQSFDEIWRDFISEREFYALLLMEGIELRGISFVYKLLCDEDRIWDVGYLAFKPRTMALLELAIDHILTHAFSTLSAESIRAAVNKRNRPTIEAMAKVIPQMRECSRDHSHVHFLLTKSEWQRATGAESPDGG
jgi:RimJ/RimL family protein N-acetyltransferase